MTVELPVNITMPLYDEIPVHQSSTYIKCPGFADNASQISRKTNCLFARPVSSQQNKKHPKEDQQRLPTNTRL